MKRFTSLLCCGLALLITGCCCTKTNRRPWTVTCAPLSAEQPGPTNRQYEPEPLPVADSEVAFVLREIGGDRFIVIRNRLTIVEACYSENVHRFLGIKFLCGSDLVIRLTAANSDPTVGRIIASLKTKYPNALFQRAWMKEVHLVPIGPWFPTETAVLPCPGFPLGDISAEFHLDAKQARRLRSLPSDALISSGALSFYECVSGRYFTETFSLRKSDLNQVR